MAVSATIYARVIISEVPSSFEPGFGFSAATQQYEGEAATRKVLIRHFPHNVRHLFSFRKLLEDDNIQKVYDYVPAEGNKKNLITYEVVDIKLSTWLNAAERSGILNTLDRHALTCRLMSQIIKAMTYLHNKNRYRWGISTNDIYLSYDDIYLSNEVERYNIKLALPKYNDEYSLINDVAVPDKCALADERKEASFLFMMLLGFLRPDRSAQFNDVVHALKTDPRFSDVSLTRKSCMWHVDRKIRFVSHISPKLNAKSGPKDFLLKSWKVFFKDQLKAIADKCNTSGKTVKDYSDSFEDLVRFMKNTFRHISDYPPEVQEFFGYDAIAALHKFEELFPTLFTDLCCVATDDDLWGDFSTDKY